MSIHIRDDKMVYDKSYTTCAIKKTDKELLRRIAEVDQRKLARTLHIVLTKYVACDPRYRTAEEDAIVKQLAGIGEGEHGTEVVVNG